MGLMDFIGQHPTLAILIPSAIIAYKAYRTTRHLTESKHTIEFETEYHKCPKVIEAHKFISKAISSFTAEEIMKLTDDNTYKE